jgi:CRP-like cAMP-binding protein
MSELTRQIFFFSGFADEERRRLLAAASLRCCSAGQTVFRQGERGDDMYVILKGAISIWQRDLSFGSEPVLAATLHEGDHFGEPLFDLCDDPHSHPDTNTDSPQSTGPRDSNRNLRLFTALCTESSEVLVLPLATVCETVRDIVTVKLKEEIATLRRTDFFKVSEPLQS